MIVVGDIFKSQNILSYTKLFVIFPCITISATPTGLFTIAFALSLSNSFHATLLIQSVALLSIHNLDFALSFKSAIISTNRFNTLSVVLVPHISRFLPLDAVARLSQIMSLPSLPLVCFTKSEKYLLPSILWFISRTLSAVQDNELLLENTSIALETIF